MDAVRGPAAGFDLVGIQSPELELFFEEGTADVRGIMKFTGSVTKFSINNDKSESGGH